MAGRPIGEVGEYPYWYKDKPDELMIQFKSKKNPHGKEVLNLIFHTTSAEKRARIKEIFAELEEIDR